MDCCHMLCHMLCVRAAVRGLVHQIKNRYKSFSTVLHGGICCTPPVELPCHAAPLAAVPHAVGVKAGSMHDNCGGACHGSSSCVPGTRRWVCQTACAPPRRAEPRPCRPASAPAALHCHQKYIVEQCHIHAVQHQFQQACSTHKHRTSCAIAM